MCSCLWQLYSSGSSPADNLPCLMQRSDVACNALGCIVRADQGRAHQVNILSTRLFCKFCLTIPRKSRCLEQRSCHARCGNDSLQPSRCVKLREAGLESTVGPPPPPTRQACCPQVGMLLYHRGSDQRGVDLRCAAVVFPWLHWNSARRGMH
jgi:hypothetical protein